MMIKKTQCFGNEMSRYFVLFITKVSPKKFYKHGESFVATVYRYDNKTVFQDKPCAGTSCRGRYVKGMCIRYH